MRWKVIINTRKYFALLVIGIDTYGAVCGLLLRANSQAATKAASTFEASFAK